jgi:hypothetical protein
VVASLLIGLLFTLMMLTKTTAVFLLPAVGWAMLLPLRHNRGLALRSALAAAGAFAVSFATWMALVVHLGLFADYKYLFFVNKYDKPKEFYWPLLSLWWSFHGGLWVDHILIPLAGALVLGALVAAAVFVRRSSGVGNSPVGWNARTRKLLADPVFGASILAVAGYILFMTYQNHPQPRYFAVVAFFSFFIVAQGVGALLGQPGCKAAASTSGTPSSGPSRGIWPRRLGWIALAAVAVAVGANAYWTLNYATHPEYTFVDAAQRLTRYIDAHPNGKRLLVSISGDQVTLITHLPSICDDFGTQELVTKLGVYQPGWFATWNDLDPGTLEDLHNRYSLEQVASFRALDDSDRDVLVLFKLHPLPGGKVREPGDQNLQIQLPDDKIDIDVE